METITINNQFDFQVKYNYFPAERTNDSYFPGSIELLSVEFFGNLLELLNEYVSTEQITEAIIQQIINNH